MNYKAVIFDLDGTLVNTIEDLSNAANAALRSFGLAERSVEECRAMIGNGLRKFIERAAGEVGSSEQCGEQGNCNGGFVDKLIGEFKVHYEQNYCEKSFVYPGVKEAVFELRANGVKLGVLTNKEDDFAVKLVEELFGKGVFEYIAGARSGRKIKPDTGSTFEALEVLGAGPGEALFVGDSDVDIFTAKAAGIRAVGVKWGYRDVNLLVDSGADVIIDEPGEIVGLIS